MSSSITSKYLQKKKKDLLEYARLLESLMTLSTNDLWKNKEEFETYAKEIINIYVDTYYFDNNIHRDNPIEYSNDNINSILKSFIEYCQVKDKMALLQNHKNESFLLSVIITTAAYLDISTNVVDGDYQDTRVKFKYLLEYLQNTNILTVYINNNRLISRLFESVRKNRAKEEKFFKAFLSEDYYNEYIKINENYNLVKFNYNLKGIEEFDASLVEGIKKSYEDKFNTIFKDLLVIRILQDLISNKEVKNYIIPNTEQISNNYLEEIDDDLIKPYICFVIDLSDNKKEKLLQEKGFNIIYELKDITDDNIKDNQTYIVPNSLKEKLKEVQNKKIEFIYKDKEENVL